MYPYFLLAAIIGVSSIVIVLIIICIKLICNRRQKWPQGSVASYSEKWEKIKYLSKNEDTRPLAIINACSLLDHALKAHGYTGETLGERLSAAHIAIGYSQISSVLRLRNDLAHNADMRPLDKEKTKQDLKIIRQVLIDLNVSV